MTGFCHFSASRSGFRSRRIALLATGFGSKRAARAGARPVRGDCRLRGHAAALYALRPSAPMRDAVRRKCSVIPRSTSITTRGRRPFRMFICERFVTVSSDRGLAGDQEKVAPVQAAFLNMSGLMNGIFPAASTERSSSTLLRGLADPAIPRYRHLGRAEPRLCAISFFLYTLQGSFADAPGDALTVHGGGCSFNILDWHQLPLGMDAQT